MAKAIGKERKVYPLLDPYATASVSRSSEKSNYLLQAKKNRTFFKWCDAKMLAEFKSAFPKQYKAPYLFKAGYLVCQSKSFLTVFLAFSFSPSLFFLSLSLSHPPTHPLTCLPSPSSFSSLLPLNIKILSVTSALLVLMLTFPRVIKLQGSFFFKSRTHLFLSGSRWEPSADHFFP